MTELENTAVAIAEEIPVLGTIVKVGSAFKSLFGGPSKADADRAKKVSTYLNETWAPIRNAMTLLIDTQYQPARELKAKVEKYPELQKDYNDLVYLYKHFFSESVLISQDVSKSKTDGATRVDNLMGLSETNKGDGAIDMFNKIYSKVIQYKTEKGEGTSTADVGFKEDDKKNMFNFDNKTITYIAFALIGLVIVFIIFKKFIK